MSRYIDADIAKEKLKEYCIDDDSTVQYWYDLMGIDDCIDRIIPTADVRDNVTAHKVVGGGERDGSTCWFECENCGLAVDIGDVFCKHCGARFVP